MRTVCIGFSRSRSKFPLFAWAIQIIERTNYSHVYVRQIRKNGKSLFYQASGTQVNFVSTRNFDNHHEVVKEFGFEISDEQYEKYIDWASEHAGDPYGLKSVFGILYSKITGQKNPFADGTCSWVCAELAGYVLVEFLNPMEFDGLENAGPRKIMELCEGIKDGSISTH